MATLVAGFATSHSPQLSTDIAVWPLHATRDRDNPLLLDTHGQFRTYHQLLACGPPISPHELHPNMLHEKHSRAQRALERLQRELAVCAPDIVIIVGDDQDEVFDPHDSPPTVALFTGPEIWDQPPTSTDIASLPPGLAQAQWAQHAAAPDRHLIGTALSIHLADALPDHTTNLHVFDEMPAGRGIGHAFTFPRLRLGLAPTVPIVPLFVNTYYPPNVPTVTDCYQLGRALGMAVQTMPGASRVAIIASGGLSHFVVDEHLDRAVLDALARDDLPALVTATAGKMRSGTSETLLWVIVAAAVQHLQMEVLDYIPAYRSSAGTGVGMAFCHWHTHTEQEPK